jgi:antirestriction protein ArdC
MENKTNTPNIKVTARDKYNKVVENFITKLENNDIEPWTKSWSLALPKNFETGNSYSGMNILTLLDRGFNDSRFLTFNQIKKLGGSVIKGETSSPVFFMKPVEKEIINEEGEVEKQSYFLMQSYNVFNIEQTSGIEYEKEQANSNKEYPHIQEFIDSLKIETYRGDPAYSPRDDCIFMPHSHEFDNDNEFYSTYLHEIGHWTGHSSRLDRFEKYSTFGDERYAFEELIAELSSAFTSLELGLKPNSKKQAAYLKSWITALKEKPNILYTAASQASKATSFLMNKYNIKKELQIKKTNINIDIEKAMNNELENQSKNNENSNNPKIA